MTSRKNAADGARDINVRLLLLILDRSNLSVTLPTITHDLNIDGATASIVLTIFIGYASFQYFLAAYLPSDTIRKNSVILMAPPALIAPFLSDLLVSVRYLICRLVLGITEGIYCRSILPATVSDKERRRRIVLSSIMDSSRIRTGIYDFVPAGCCLRLAKCFYYHSVRSALLLWFHFI